MADAVRRSDDDELPGELGDLLLNVAFQIVLAEERRAFGTTEVVAELERKMVARHPHVFGDADEAPDWERMKAGERARRTTTRHRFRDALAGVPAGLEPLSRALRMQERAAGVGFDWPDVGGALGKLREEITELEAVIDGRAATPSSDGPPPSAAVVDEAGDLMFAAINVCRLAGVHPSTALSAGTEKFARRFRALAERSETAGLDMTSADLETLDRMWDEIKRDE